MYLVLSLTKELSVNVLGAEVDMPLVYADGMLGALPVFSTKEAAEEFALSPDQVVEIEHANGAT